MRSLKCASFFAGVGGIDIGFEQNRLFNIVYANEADPGPAATYEANSPLKVDVRDIREVKPEEIPNFDVMLAGFPCQPFSVAGYRKGFDDGKGRGTLFFELVRIMEAKRPQIVFLENVKNLASHNGGRTFSVIREALEGFGYHVIFKVLNAMTHGNIPQNRERIYIVCFLDMEAWRRFCFPGPVKLETRLSDVIDFSTMVDEKYCYTAGKYKGDIYEKLAEAMDDDSAVYQWRRKYVRKNKSGVIPTLTANQGGGGHNVCLIKTKYGIRKMTPRECFNAQGFPKSFMLPAGICDSKLYKQAGNSVCVPVIARIADSIAEVMTNAVRA